jgi:DNA-binding NarL/FixJ family response regulator
MAAYLLAHREERPIFPAEPTADYSDIGLPQAPDSSTEIPSQGPSIAICLPTPEKRDYRKVAQVASNGNPTFREDLSGSGSRTTDEVQEALRIRPLGYVLKVRVGTELLASVDAVCQGKKFVSST